MATKKLPPFMGKESKAEEAKEMKIKAVSPKMYQKGEKAEGVHKMAKGGMTKMGSVKTSSKPDGVAVKGKTKGTMVKMAGGGRSC